VVRWDDHLPVLCSKKSITSMIDTLLKATIMFKVMSNQLGWRKTCVSHLV
jgi:hypothetical protein